MGGIDIDHVAGDKPVEQNAERGQVLLDGRRRNHGLQVLDESGDMERLDAGKLIDVFAAAPGGEAPGGVHIGSAGVIVVDLAGEEFQDAFQPPAWAVKNGAGWRSGEDAMMTSVVMQLCKWRSLPCADECDKERYNTLSRPMGTENSAAPVLDKSVYWGPHFSRG